MEAADKLHYHELCIYFLMDISDTDLLAKGESFTIHDDPHILKEEIFSLPKEFTIRTEIG